MTDFDKWLDDLPLVEEDHVFVPVGNTTEEMAALLRERAELLKAPVAQGDPEGEVPATERSLADSYTDRRNDIDERIAAQLEKDHPNALRIKIRGLSDDDVEEIQDEVAALIVEGKPLSPAKQLVEWNLRFVARAAVQPTMTPQDVRLLRRKLNRGEWARLLDHVTRLMSAEAESIDLPNS